MMLNRIKSTLIGCLALLFAGNSLSESKTADLSTGAEVFKQCAACHMASGVGVPGAFPPLRGRIASLSASEAGRQYLSSVLLQGLNGTIEVDGKTYNGFMQPYGNSLTDEQLSAVLNFVAIELNDEPPEDYQPYVAQDFSDMREQLKAQGLSSLELRKDAIE